MKRTVTLVVLDGWGIGQENDSNPIYVVKPKYIDYVRHNFLAGSLQASGIAVGLPWGEEGNSEVGHLTMGAGKVLYQHFPRITLAIRDGSFFKNEVLKAAFAHAKKNNSAVNFAGLLTKGSVHSSFDHLEGLLEMAAKEGVQNIKLHLFMDGKDSPPKSAIELIKKLKEVIEKHGRGTIASLSGRYYAMDRDLHWDRTEQAYRVITGEGDVVGSAEEALQKNFANNLNEEFLKPARLADAQGLQDNDAILFFNFREDSMRQIAQAFVDQQFQSFPVKKFQNLYLCSMTRYQEKFPMAVAFPPERVDSPLGKILEDNNKTQLRIAETEKYAHVTYFFNGLREAPFKNEFRVLIPSQNVPHHDQYPEMMAVPIADRVVASIAEGGFDFILMNFANPDMIAHTGNFDAAVKAVQTIDEQIGRLVKVTLEQNRILVITADHGNVERLRNPLTGMPETGHDPSPVPIYIVGKEFTSKKGDEEVRQSETESVGILADVAPTILELMSLSKPKEMTGQSLIKFLI